MRTKSELEEELRKVNEQNLAYRRVILNMRSKTHEFIAKGSTWSNAYLIQHFTEILERNAS